MIRPIKLGYTQTTKMVLRKYPNMISLQEFWEFANPKNKIYFPGHFFFTMEKIGRVVWMAYLDTRDGGRGISCFPVLPRDLWYEYYQVLTK